LPNSKQNSRSNNLYVAELLPSLPNTKKELVYFYFNPRGIKDLNEESKKFRKELDKK
jgi:hypothetical protein